MDELLSINITIADRRYPMRIKRNDEEKIRKAVKLINERILQYQDRYSGKDVQDFLAMASLQFVLQTLETIEQSEVDPVIQQIGEINRELIGYLTEK
ncbi:MAG TPA: cell division protein ZapA [Prolixibacteraceae bacterium]|nr:cell division protein ZapA [Prolixibacteraceae bacterium]